MQLINSYPLYITIVSMKHKPHWLHSRSGTICLVEQVRPDDKEQYGSFADKHYR